MRLWIILQKNGVFGSNICMGGKLHLNEGAEFGRRRKAVLEQHKGIGAFAACHRVCITTDVDDMLRHALISIFVRRCKVFCLGSSALSDSPFFPLYQVCSQKPPAIQTPIKPKIKSSVQRQGDSANLPRAAPPLPSSIPVRLFVIFFCHLTDKVFHIVGKRNLENGGFAVEGKGKFV